MIVTRTPEVPPQWLLLDVPGTPQAGVMLRQMFAQARWSGLFEGTEWHALREQGPLLVDLRTCPALADLCASNDSTPASLTISNPGQR